jgi:hypothetical protein
MVEDIQQFVKNKSILFVGNSVEIMKHNLAEFIDGFDIVVRFGRAITFNEKQQKKLGKKCDIWITGQFRAPEFNKHRESFESGEFKNTKILLNRCRGNFKLKDWKIEEHLPDGMPYTQMFTDNEIIHLMKKEFNKDMLDNNEYRPSAGFISLLWFIDKIKTYKDIHLIGFDFFAKKTNIKPTDKRGFTSNCRPHSWHLPVYVLNRPAHDGDMERKYVQKLVDRGFCHWYVLGNLKKEIVKYDGWMKGEKIISSIPRKTKVSKI